MSDGSCKECDSDRQQHGVMGSRKSQYKGILLRRFFVANLLCHLTKFTAQFSRRKNGLTHCWSTFNCKSHYNWITRFCLNDVNNELHFYSFNVPSLKLTLIYLMHVKKFSQCQTNFARKTIMILPPLFMLLSLM